MPNGTVKWFNPTIGAGFIRTDDGENVLLLRSALQGLDPDTVRKGLRVSVDILEGPHGKSAGRVKAGDLQEH